MEIITRQQLNKINKVFRRSGKSFQSLAEQAGIDNTESELDLTRDEARQFLKYHEVYLRVGKEKQ